MAGIKEWLVCRKAIVEQVNQLIEAYIHLAALPASSDVSNPDSTLNNVWRFLLSIV